MTALPIGPDHQVYQPIVTLDGRDVVGYEVLSRFEGSTPQEAFAVAIETGKGVELDLACIEMAIKAFDHLPSSVWLDVNIDPTTMVEIDLLHLLLDDGVPMHRLVLEITEDAELDYLKVYEPTWRLKQRGVRLALDDVGKAYARMLQQHEEQRLGKKAAAPRARIATRVDTPYGRIVQMMPGMIKIDRELIDGIARNPIKRALIRSIVGLGADLSAVVVAEGVESQEETDWLQAIGVQLGQGWLLGRPAALDSLPGVS